MADDFAKAFVHAASKGSQSACEAALASIGSDLRALYDADRIEGYQAMVVESAAQEEDEFIPAAADGARTRPYLFLRIQPMEGSDWDLGTWAESNGVQPFV